MMETTQLQAITTGEADPVGLAELAERLGVQRTTAKQWRTRELLPSPRWTVSGAPAWDWSADVEPWARRTGRYRETLTRAEWAALPADYRLVRPDGTHCMLQFVEGVGTCLVPVTIAEGAQGGAGDRGSR